MAASKRKKQIKQKENPKGKSIVQGGNPNRYYTENPAWSFANSDQDMWPFTQNHIDGLIWTEILPRLKALESQTWNEILIKNKKQNHSINVEELVLAEVGCDPTIKS